MFLMYYIDDNGDRVYTFKVCMKFEILRFIPEVLHIYHNQSYKLV